MAEAAHYLAPQEWPKTSHLITEDDEPLDSTFQERQQRILTDALPYVVLYDPYGYLGDRPLRAFEHHGTGYVELLRQTTLGPLALGLATWEGEYQGCRARFLGFTDTQGKLLATGQERAEQEHQRAEHEPERAARLEAEVAELRRRLDLRT